MPPDCIPHLERDQSPPTPWIADLFLTIRTLPTQNRRMAETTLEEVSKRTQDMFHKGMAAMERENLDYAIDMFFTCIEQEPNFLQARKFLRSAEIQKFKKNHGGGFAHVVSSLIGFPQLVGGAAQLKLGKTEKALATAEKLLRRDPLNMKFINFLARVAEASDMPEVAVLTLEQAREAYPTSAHLAETLGHFYTRTNQMREARTSFERLAELRPKDQTAIKLLKDSMARHSMAEGQWEEALDGRSFRDRVKDSDETETLERESKAVRSERDTEALIEDSLQKIEKEPGNMNFRRQLARLYLEVADFENAIDVLQNAQEASDGDPEIDRMLSTVYVQLFDAQISELEAGGDAAGAATRQEERDAYVFSDLNDRVARYPNDLSLRYDLGLVLYAHGDYDEAIRQFQQAQRFPQHRTESIYRLAMCFKEKTQFDLARQQLDRCLEELPGMNEMRKEVLYQLGLIAEASGDRASAAEHFKEVYQTDISYKDVAEKIESSYGS